MIAVLRIDFHLRKYLRKAINVLMHVNGKNSYFKNNGQFQGSAHKTYPISIDIPILTVKATSYIYHTETAKIPHLMAPHIPYITEYPEEIYLILNINIIFLRCT